MSYRLEHNERLSEGIKRIAHEQVSAAIHALRAAEGGPNEAIHTARKHFKKVRALLRLVRDEVGKSTYQSENRYYRDMGRKFSEVRDAYVALKSLDTLYKNNQDVLEENTMYQVRELLQAIYNRHATRSLQPYVMHSAADDLETSLQRINEWPIESEDFGAIGHSLRRVYKRGYKRMDDVANKPSPGNFHEWRKRVKYLWYHLRILKPVWSNVFEVWAKLQHDLADALGDTHDMAELQRMILALPLEIVDTDSTRTLLNIVANEQAQYESLAIPLGRRLYAEKPAAFVDRIEKYWEVWRTDTIREPLGYLQALG